MVKFNEFKPNISAKYPQFKGLLDKLYEQWNNGKEMHSAGLGWDKFTTDMWLIIHPLYNFIEQGLKMIQVCDKGGYNTGHNLLSLFNELNEDCQTKFQKDFDEYLELKPGFFEKDVAKFIKYIDSEDGYNKWKYVLLHNDRVNYLHVDALFVIAQTIVSILFMEAQESRDDGIDKNSNYYKESSAGPFIRFDMEMSNLLHETTTTFFRENNNAGFKNYRKLMDDNRMKLYSDITKYIVDNERYWKEDAAGNKYRFSDNPHIEKLFTELQEIIRGYKEYCKFPWISWINNNEEYSYRKNMQFIEIYSNHTGGIYDDDHIEDPAIRSIEYYRDFNILIVEFNTGPLNYERWRYNNISFMDYWTMTGKKNRGNPAYIDADSDDYLHIENWFNTQVKDNSNHQPERVWTDEDIEYERQLQNFNK